MNTHITTACKKIIISCLQWLLNQQITQLHS